MTSRFLDAQYVEQKLNKVREMKTFRKFPMYFFSMGKEQSNRDDYLGFLWRGVSNWVV